METDLLVAAGTVPVTLRGYHGEADLANIVTIVNASRSADGIEQLTNLPELTNMYTHLTNCNLAHDLVFAEVPGEAAPVGYGRCWWLDEANTGQRWYIFVTYVRPEWRQRGAEPALLAWLEGRLRQIAAAHDFAGERVLQTDAEGTETWRQTLFEAAGYRPVRWGFQMRRSLGEPVEVTPLPEGIVVRPPANADEVRAVWLADGEAFKDHWGYVPPTENDYLGWLKQPTFNPTLWMIGWDAATGEVAGQVQNFVNAEENERLGVRRGYTEGISVRRAWRRRGLARALLTRSLQMFKDTGYTEAALSVDAENLSGALNLYQSVGFYEVQRGATYRKPLVAAGGEGLGA